MMLPRALPLLALALGFGAEPVAAQLRMETDALTEGNLIPVKYAANGSNVQPGFTFSAAPDDTVAYAIILYSKRPDDESDEHEDLHWMVWDIPADDGEVKEGMLPEGSVQGMNVAGQNAYLGPAAAGLQYVFELYALKEMLGLDESASRADLVAAMQDKIADQARYVGRLETPEDD